jgi:hypothetical protein
MSIASVARRLAVTVPFFSLAAVVLGLLSNPAVPRSSLVDSPPPLILIVTPESLNPAFLALGAWNQGQGGRSVIVPFEPGSDRREMLYHLASLCRKEQATGLLLGGNAKLVPLLPDHAGHHSPVLPGSGPRILPVPTPRAGLMPKGLAVGRAPVGDLAEAWAFVNACRTSGRTLNQLMDASTVPSTAQLPEPVPFAINRSLLVSALTRPIR